MSNPNPVTADDVLDAFRSLERDECLEMLHTWAYAQNAGTREALRMARAERDRAVEMSRALMYEVDAAKLEHARAVADLTATIADLTARLAAQGGSR